MSREPYVWTPRWTTRLEELIAGGLLGEDIACTLTLEMGRIITRQAVYMKANELGLSLRGRSQPLDTPIGPSNPFSRPKWLSKSIEASERQRHPAPGAILVYHEGEDPPDKTPSYLELWRKYVDNVVSSDKASVEEGEAAKLLRIPQWFLSWAIVVLVEWSAGMRGEPT